MATPTPLPKPRAYRDFLTPLLHRRFTDASLLVLGLCWLEATLLSSSSFYRAWIPFGMTGVRTLLLFIPSLAIFVIRLTDLHFGARTTASNLDLARKELLSAKTGMIVLWYLFSATIFGEIFIWSKGQDADLGWVDYGKAYERPRLNENPMFLRYCFIVTALLSAIVHIARDGGHVDLSLKQAACPKESIISKLPLVQQKLFSTLPASAHTAFNLTVATLAISIVSYWLGPRSIALQFAHFFGSMLSSNLPHRAHFDGIYNIASLFWNVSTSSFLLNLLWTFCNATFAAYIAQPPLKKGQPLTSEVRDNSGRVIVRSATPNASLLTGIKSKKEAPHTFALWELSIICEQFEARRKTIFLEVDKTAGSTWSQVLQACSAEISAITTRISAYQAALNGPAPAQPAASQPPIRGLPRIASEQAKQGDILNKPLPDLAHSVSNMARSAGSHPNAQNPLSPVAQRAITWSKDRLLTPEQQRQLSSGTVRQETSSKLLEVLRTPLGVPFRQTFQSKVKSVLFGTPYSSKYDILHAASALSSLLKASLIEDTCGLVAKDVPSVIRLFTSTINSVKTFVRSAKPHWTDVYFEDSQRQITEVAEVVVELQAALETILLAFSEYASALGISKKELREAKEAIGMHERQEMVKV